ncbi:hypothetical protein B0H14DRAFT_2570646 [Mycena olivaceomarginata]|nr:hypothetical protein B0H14DRAFT_2570646 [Mycena olivaceomarginata]
MAIPFAPSHHLRSVHASFRIDKHYLVLGLIQMCQTGVNLAETQIKMPKSMRCNSTCAAAVPGSITGGKHYTHFLVDNGEVRACGRYGSDAMTILAQAAQAQHSFRHICGHNPTSRTKLGFQAVSQTASTFEDAPIVTPPWTQSSLVSLSRLQVHISWIDTGHPSIAYSNVPGPRSYVKARRGGSAALQVGSDGERARMVAPLSAVVVPPPSITLSASANQFRHRSRSLSEGTVPRDQRNIPGDGTVNLQEENQSYRFVCG